MDVVTVRPAFDPGLASRSAGAAATRTDLPPAQAVASLARPDRTRFHSRREHGVAATRSSVLSAMILDDLADAPVDADAHQSAETSARLRAYAAPREDEPTLLSAEA